MKIKDFKKLVKEIVEQEMITQKEQILKEIKAELFDIMTVQKAPTPQTKSEVNEGLDRASLRRLFQDKLGTGEDIHLNTSNVSVTPQQTLPSTFEGTRLTEDHEDTLKLINKDYSQLMKKMGV
tara:strand:- start:877 stop:1245 length:369 start_codon:yes stop_codon:yes gene_type:complete